MTIHLRLTIVLASGVLALPVAVLPVATASGALSGCETAAADVNVWKDRAGNWSDYTHWSLGTVPAADSGQSVCIPDNVDLTFDVDRADLQHFELGSGSRLTMKEGTAFYLWGGQDQESLTRPGSVVEVRGADLGGPGQLRVLGEVQMASTEASPARLTSGGGASGGRMVVGDEGTLDFTGRQANARLSGGYTVVVHGRARLLEDAGLVADAGTRFELQKHEADDGQLGRFVIRNDRGYFAPEDTESLSDFVNEGKIVKWESPDSSAITAAYSGGGQVRIRTGYLVLPTDVEENVQVASGATVGSGLCVATEARTCVTQTTPEEPQFASLEVPGETVGFVDVDLEVLDSTVPSQSVGQQQLVEADGITADPDDPAVIQLRYDQQLLDGRAPILATLSVARLNRMGHWVDLPDCLGTTVPPGVAACLDRRVQATRRDKRDVIMVVRTKRSGTYISRWIPH